METMLDGFCFKEKKQKTKNWRGAGDLEQFSFSCCSVSSDSATALTATCMLCLITVVRN